MKIYVRDDDVLCPSRAFKDPFAQFLKVHETVVANGAIHRPAILCGEMHMFLPAVEFIRHEWHNGTMEPQLHGWNHVDYGKMSELEVRNDLGRCVGWMEDFLWTRPTRWYTPWGANSPMLTSVAADFGMKLIDCSDIIPPHRLDKIAKVMDKDEVELFFHWWSSVPQLDAGLKKLRGQ